MRLFLSCLILLFAGTVSAGELSIRTAVFAGDIEATTQLPHDPTGGALNSKGTLLFYSNLGPQGGPTPPGRSVSLDRNGEKTLVAREGQTLPDGTVVEAIMEAQLDDEDRVLLMFGKKSTVDITSLWLWDNGDMRLIAKSGQAAPGTGTTFNTISLQKRPKYNNGRLAFYAHLDTADDDTAQSLWYYDGTNLTLLGRGDGPAPALATPSRFLGFNSFDEFALSASGTLVYTALVRPDAVGGGGDKPVLYRYSNGTHSVIAIRTVPLPDGGNIFSLANVTINAKDDVLFTAIHDPGPFGTIHVYLLQNNTLKKVLKTGDTIEGFQVQDFYGAALIENGRVFYNIKVGGTGVTGKGYALAVQETTGAQKIVVFDGGPAEGFGSSKKFEMLRRFSFDNEGRVAIHAKVTPGFPNTNFNSVILIQNRTTGVIEVQAKPGDAFNSSTADTIARINTFGTILEDDFAPTIETGRDGRPTLFSDTYEYVFQAAGTVVDGFGVLVLSPAIVINTIGDEADANLDDGVPDVDLAKEGNQCTLRCAIQNANRRIGKDRVVFNIPIEQIADAQYTINIQSPLPDITDPIDLDGSTQPGGASKPIVVINGAMPFNGEDPATRMSALLFKTGDSRIAGLAIVSFPGAAIDFSATHNNIISRNYLGVNPIKTQPFGNVEGVLLARSGGNQVLSNVIGFNKDGIRIDGHASSMGENRIEGNRIGVDASGFEPRGNFRAGIYISNGDGNRIIGNQISGNGDRIQLQLGNVDQPKGGGIMSSPNGGILLEGEAADVPDISVGNVVQGNLIGCDAFGEEPIANTHGIYVFKSVRNYIGGDQPKQGNLISGNKIHGIVMESVQFPKKGLDFDLDLFLGRPGGNDVLIPRSLQSRAVQVPGGGGLGGGLGGLPPAPTGFQNTIINNTIGLQQRFNSELKNEKNGIFLDRASAVEVRDNLIAGNGANGLEIRGRGAVQANYIVSNNIGLANQSVQTGNGGNGIVLTSQAAGNVVRKNTIVASKSNGILCDQGARKNVLINNTVGGIQSFEANGGDGIVLQGCFFNVVGRQYLDPVTKKSVQEGNRIKFNKGRGFSLIRCQEVQAYVNEITENEAGGVLVDSSNTCTLNDNKIFFNKGPGIEGKTGGNSSYQANMMEGNTGLGIDLGPVKDITPNDRLDTDVGVNGLVNTPEIDGIFLFQGDEYDVIGRINTTPNTRVKIDFYRNLNPDDSGSGEGFDFIDAPDSVVTTNSQGFARFKVRLKLPNGPDFLSATTNNPELLSTAEFGTSEFSANRELSEIAVDLELTQQVSPIVAAAKEPLTFTATLVNKGQFKATAVKVNATLASGLKFVSATPGKGTATQKSGIITFDVGELDRDESVQMVYVATPSKPGLQLQIGSSDSLEPDVDPQDNSANSVFFVVNALQPGNSAPTLASTPTVTPNPGTQYQALTFAALAADPENQELLYAWDFGDGSDPDILSGATTRHAYMRAGVYTATVTVFDAGGASASGTVIVMVNRLGGGQGDNDGDGIVDELDPDDDNDGIPDERDFDIDGDGATNFVEADAGTNPGSKLSFPPSIDNDGDGIPDGIDTDIDNDGILDENDPDIDGDGFSNEEEEAVGTDPFSAASKPGTFALSTVTGSFRFDMTGKDKLKFTTTLPAVEKGFKLAGKLVSLSIGDFSTAFALDAKGASKSKPATISIKQNKKTGVLALKASFSGDLQSALGDADRSLPSQTLALTARVGLTGSGTQGTLSATFTTSKGKSGKLVVKKK